jgi:N-acetylglucosamine-6-phosphate deacetylase
VTLLLRGGSVVVAGAVAAVDVRVDDGVIVEIGPDQALSPSRDVIDAAAFTIVPGFVDAQVNGGFGIDVTSQPERIAELGRGLARFGVTSFLPTVVSCEDRVLDRVVAAFGSYRHDGGAEAVGLHLEGPMLAPARRGAHPIDRLQQPSLDLVGDWTPARGIRLVTLAPELPGALDVVAALAARGVVVAAGHTDATLDELRAGVDAGVTMVTHLFNGMRPFAHRDPGPVGAAIVDDRLAAGLICDGVHVHPAAVHLAWRGLGPERTVLVTDAVSVMGGGGGADAVGPIAVTRRASGVRTADGVLAGSDVAMDAAVRNLMSFTGCTLAEATRAASTNPARVLGLGDRGVIEVGRRADLVVLDADGEVQHTIVAGAVAFSRRAPADGRAVAD